MDRREKQLDPMGPLSSRSGSVPEILRKHIATCDFPGGGVQTLFTPLSAHVTNMYAHVSLLLDCLNCTLLCLRNSNYVPNLSRGSDYRNLCFKGDKGRFCDLGTIIT